jgi:hypothetical protein
MGECAIRKAIVTHDSRVIPQKAIQLLSPGTIGVLPL